MQKIIVIMFQFLKATKKMKTSLKFEAPVSTHRKMAALSIFARNSQKLILFGRYFSTSQLLAIYFSQCA